jgi:hypothetical protein
MGVGSRQAARNNAEWCATFCGTHGIATSFHDDCWFSSARTPPLYPDAVTLVPRVDADSLVARIDATSGATIKDSFACLELDVRGFTPLFRAEWLICELPSTKRGIAGVWVTIEDPRELATWEAAWADTSTSEGFFRPALLQDGGVAILARRAGNDIVAGAIANRTSGVVGLSNVFDRRGDLESAWIGSAAAATARWPRPLVGYESGQALVAARAAGFRSVGELVVWVKPGATV